jgi:hypothetical protein
MVLNCLQSHINRHTHAICTFINRILCGDRKGELCQKWLNLIVTKVLNFLDRYGYKVDALPEYYTEQQPADLDVVEANIEIIQRIVKKDSSEFDDFIEMTRSEAYVLVDRLLSEIDFVLTRQGDWSVSDLCATTNQTAEWVQYRLNDVRKDFDYLLRMKEMDNVIQEKMRCGEMRGSKIELSDIVPISGLILSQFYMKEVELTTAMEKWAPKKITRGSGERRREKRKEKRKGEEWRKEKESDKVIMRN